MKKISRLFKIKFTQFKVFSIRLLVYSISLPQKRVYWWTVLGSVKFYLQICLQFLFWCQIRGHIKSSLSLPFFSPSIDCVRLLRSFVLVICQKLCSPSLHLRIEREISSILRFVLLHRKSIALHHHAICKINRQDLDEGPQSNKDNISIQQMLKIGFKDSCFTFIKRGCELS